MKIAYQGIAGSYSESCAKKKYPNCETIPCKTFDECFEKANTDSSVKAIIPESNKTTGNIGVEYLIFKYRLNIFAEHFFPINHNLLGLPGSKTKRYKRCLFSCSSFKSIINIYKKNKLMKMLEQIQQDQQNMFLKLKINQKEQYLLNLAQIYIIYKY